MADTLEVRVERVARVAYETATKLPWSVCPESVRLSWLIDAHMFVIKYDAAKELSE